MSNITFGQFLNTNSALHKLDPRTKLLCSFVFAWLVFLPKTPVALLLNLVVIVLLYYFANVPLVMFVRNIKGVLPMLVLAGAVNLFLLPGEPFFVVFGISITKQGLNLVLLMFGRIILLVSGFALLTYTTSPLELTGAIQNLLRPLKIFKISPGEIAMVLSIALRFVPTLLQEANKIMDAQKARGASFESGRLKERLKAYIAVIIPLLFSSMAHANSLASAMESRCYSGAEHRTRFRVMRFSLRDASAVVVILAYILVLTRVDSWCV